MFPHAFNLSRTMLCGLPLVHSQKRVRSGTQKARGALLARFPKARRELRFEVLEPRTLLSASALVQPVVALAEPMGSVMPLAGALTPQQIKTAYGINLLSQEGSGQTIAIVDAFDDPCLVSSGNAAYANSDLHEFDAYYGLPDFGGPSQPTFTKLDQDGGTNYPAVQTAPDPLGDWEAEEAMDVEWAHAIAPGANIILVEANSGSTSDLMAAVNTARNIPGVSVVSMSWGGNELTFNYFTNYNSYFTTPAGHIGITFLAATGDSGSPASYPAFSPNVLAVGGTTLTLNSDGSYNSETGWDGSGGGISQIESQPSYQQGLVIHNGTSVVNANGMRTVPDVAFDADDINSGVAVYDSYNGAWWNPAENWFETGGTSFATPCWSGLIALADEMRVSAGLGTLDGPTQTLPVLYSLPAADFHEVTSGSTYGNPWYAAGPGYNLVTGLGTPVANLLVPALADVDTGGGTITLTPSTPALPADTLGVTYDQMLTASGGTGSVALVVSNIQNAINGLTGPLAAAAH